MFDSLPQVPQGGNLLIELPLTQADGSALPVPSLDAATVELWQEGRNLRTTYTLEASADSPLRAGGEASLMLEITPAFSARCAKGIVKARWLLTVSDAAFAASGGVQLAPIVREEFLVV